MTKPQIKIFDHNFLHTEGISDVEPSFFQWYRGIENPDNTAWFSETHLGLARSIDVKRKIAILVEPPSVSPRAYHEIKEIENEFDYILTHQLDLEDDEKYLWYPFGGCWIPRVESKIYSKSETVSIIASNKNYTEGHQLRQRFLREYGKEVAVFGRGINPIESKVSGLGPYRFSIVIENDKSFFTEKLIDCFACGTIPIYWGTDYLPYINQDGMILFNDISEIPDILESLTIELYIEKLDAIQRNLEIVNTYRICEDWIWKQYPFLFGET